MNSRRFALFAAAAMIGAALLLVWQPWSPPPTVAEDAAEESGDARPVAGGFEREQATEAIQADPQVAEVERAGLERTEVAGDRVPAFAIRGRLLVERDVPFQGARILVYRGKPGDEKGAFQSFFRGLAEVDLNGPPPEFGLRSEGEPMVQAEVQPDGTFRVAGLRHRHLRLDLDHDLYGMSEPEPVHAPPGQAVVDVGVLEPYLGGMLRGRLVGSAARAGTRIQLITEMDPMTVMRDPQAFMGLAMRAGHIDTRALDDLTFVFRAVWPSSDLKLLVEDDEAAGYLDGFGLQPAETLEVLLPVVAAAGLRVTVGGPDGEPVERARVVVRHADTRGDMTRGAASRRKRTGPDGEAVIRGLREGPHRVIVSRDGLTGASREVELRAGATSRLEIRLGAGGSVRGIVLDADGNTVSDAGVAHMPSMEVPVVGDVFGAVGSDLLAKRAHDSRCRTDAEGRFHLTGLEDEGEFHVVAWHEDFVGGMTSGVRMGDGGVEVVLARPAVVTGRVVAAESGEPLSEFEVETSVSMMLFLDRPTRIERHTDSEDGMFRLEKVPPGRMQLTARAEGRSETSVSMGVEGGATHDAGTIELPLDAVVRGIVRAPTSSGTGGAPVAGATVQKRQTGMMKNPAMAMFGGSAVARTDADGSFELKGLSGSRTILQASAEGWATGYSERIEIAPGRVTEGVEIVLGEGGTVVGRLLLPDGAALQDWQILASMPAVGAVGMTVPEPDGSFRIEALDPGRYDIQAMNMTVFATMDDQAKRNWRPGQGFDLSEFFDLITEQVITTRCVVEAGEEVEVVLDGTDLDVAGRTLEVRVFVGTEPLETGWAEATYLDSSRMLTGFIQDGRMKLSRLHPGSLRVQVRSGMAMAPIGQPRIVEVPEADGHHSLDLRLPGGEIHGKVLEAKSGEPLAAAMVRAVRQDAEHPDDPAAFGFALTDEEGRFTFRGMVGGSYDLIADNRMVALGGPANAASRLRGVRLEDGERIEGLVLHATPGAGVEVRVVDALGRPVAGAMLLAVDPQGQPVGTLGLTFSGAGGRAFIPGMPEGAVRIVGRAPGWAPSATEVQEVHPSQHVEFHLTLERGTPVLLRPVDRRGNTLHGAIVAARIGSGPWVPDTLLVQNRNAEGTLDLGPMPRGTCEIRVFHPDVGQFTVERTIGSGSSVTLVLQPE